MMFWWRQDSIAGVIGQDLSERDWTKQFFPTHLPYTPLRPLIYLIDRRGCMAEVRRLENIATMTGAFRSSRRPDHEWWITMRTRDGKHIMSPLRLGIGYRDGQTPAYEFDWWCMDTRQNRNNVA